MESDVEYSDMTRMSDFFLPLRIRMDRPLDGYVLNMEFKSWRINNGLPDNAFVLKPPEGVQIVPLKEKTRSNAS